MAIRFDVEFEGTYRRLIDLNTWDGQTVVGWLEDDYHHFGMTLIHDGAVVTDLRVALLRYPWSACPGAGEPLRALVGKPLFGRCADIGKLLDMREQCTHLFDLAGLMVAHAFRRGDHRRYHATLDRLDAIAPHAPAGWLQAALRCNGRQVMAWDVNHRTIVRPEGAAARSIDHGFRRWTDTMDDTEAEYAWVLRRAVFVGLGRRIMMTEPLLADEMPLPSVCHNYQPQQRVRSLRILENNRRFNSGPDGMLSLVGTKP